jgi:hypothetical protein
LDSTIGSRVQSFEQQRTRHIVAPDVILNVQRSLGARPNRTRVALRRARLSNGRIHRWSLDALRPTAKSLAPNRVSPNFTGDYVWRQNQSVEHGKSNPF